MIKRTLYFGNNAYLHTKDEQLIIDFKEENKEAVLVSIEDIGVVILDAYQLTISLNLITKLLHNNVAIITCNEKHMPQGLVLNLDGNSVQQERFQIQLSASLPLKKQLWQQTIKAKIENQRRGLLKIRKSRGQCLAKKDLQNMEYWRDSVKSGDPDNYEARAAAFYWHNYFTQVVDNFTRGRFESEPNNLLNYGYAILRAIAARSLVASGLMPSYGIHHRNKYNSYVLADDIMEPYRPYVDEIAYEIIEKYFDEECHDELELTPEIKREILKIPAIDVVIDGQKSPLMIAMQRTTASLFSCFAGESRKLLFPVFE